MAWGGRKPMAVFPLKQKPPQIRVRFLFEGQNLLLEGKVFVFFEGGVCIVFLGCSKLGIALF